MDHAVQGPLYVHPCLGTHPPRNTPFPPHTVHIRLQPRPEQGGAHLRRADAGENRARAGPPRVWLGPGLPGESCVEYVG